jgi:hypothetical protein
MESALSNSAVVPSATPTEADLEAWRDLPRDEQVRRLSRMLASPEAFTACEATMAEIWDEIEADASVRG